MNLYRRTRSPYYWYDFTVDGRRYRDTTRRTKKAEAERVMMEEYRRVQNIVQHGEKPEITIGDAYDRTIATVDGKTATSYLLCKRKLLGLDVFEDDAYWSLKASRNLSSLTQGDLEDLKAERAGEGLAANSINVEIRTLRRVHNLVSRRFRVNHELRFEQLKGFVRRRHFTTDEEQAILTRLQAAGGPAYIKAADLFIFLIDTGPRLEEALAIRWSDIDLDRAMYTMHRPKTDTVSLVPMSNRLVDNLRRRHNQPKPFLRMSRSVRLLRDAINVECNQDKTIVKTLGRAVVHSCRDTYVTRMESKGLSLRKIGKIIGHNSIDTTKKYAHLGSADVLEEARRLINDAS